MVPQRPFAPGDRGAREIERRRDLAAVEGADGFGDRGQRDLLAGGDAGDERADVEGGIVEREQHFGEEIGGERRQVALQVHHHVVAAGGVQFHEGRVHAVAAARQVRVGQNGDPAGGADGVGDGRIGAGDGYGPDARLAPAVEHVHDHRAAVNVGERFAGQPGGRHPGRNDHDRIHCELNAAGGSGTG